jgi:hypothetical protein
MAEVYLPQGKHRPIYFTKQLDFMKIITGFLVFILGSVAVFAQSNTYTLKGYIAIEGGESFTYKLIFTDSAGSIKGYSLIYTDEKKDVRTALHGSINRNTKQLLFNETTIEYNHGFESNATLCLIVAQLNYNCSKGNCTLSGRLTSSDVTQATCSAGTISFPDQEALLQLFTERPKADTLVPLKKAVVKNIAPAAKIKVVYDTPKTRQIAPSATDEITKGVEKIMDWESDTLYLEVWDGGNVDEDKISISLNGALLLKHYVLAKQKKVVKVFLPAHSKSRLVILAENEGNEPPNTADLILKDGGKEYHIVAYNDIGQEAVINLQRK